MIDWLKRYEEIKWINQYQCLDHEYVNKIRVWEREMIDKERKEAMHEAIFKMYCPLIAAGVSKDILKPICKDLLKQYEILLEEKIENI